MAQTIDHLVASLVNMGFPLEDCQDAVRCGKMSVASALEWILAGKPGCNVDQPVLRLNQSRTNPPPHDEDASVPSTSKCTKFETSTSQSKDEITPRGETVPIVSRYAMTRDQREKFRDQKLQKFKDEVKQHKAMEKKAKSLILQEIEADKEARRMKSQRKDDVDPQKDAPAVTMTTPKSSKCNIQFRLPNGNNVRGAFANEATLSNLVVFVMEKESALVGKKILFIQPFPRKEFNPGLSSDSILQLGLCPSASLVVQIAKKEEETPQAVEDRSNALEEVGDPPSQSVEPIAVRMQVGEAPGAARMAEGHLGNLEELSNIVMRPPPGQEYFVRRSPSPPPMWPEGEGHRLEENMEEGDNDEDVGPNPEMEVDPIPEELRGIDEHLRNRLPQEFGPLQNRSEAAVFSSPIGNATSQQRSHIWGVGHVLEEDLLVGEHSNVVEVQEPTEHQPSQHDEDTNSEQPDVFHPQLGVGARLGGTPGPGNPSFRRSMSPNSRRNQVAQSHEAGIGDGNAGSPGLPDRRNIFHPRHTLTDLCMQAVMSRIGAEGRASLSSFGNLPPQLAERFFHHMVKCRKLNSTNIILFRSSPITSVKLDYYIYATNQLLNSLQTLPNLQHLSLRGCSILTDVGLKAISSWKRLKSLNLEGCTQFTDRGLGHLYRLSRLSSLVLNMTHVTDVGVQQYLQHRECPEALVKLSLGVTEITDSVIVHFQRFTNLHDLNLSQTKITSLELLVQHASRISRLDISGCRIMLEEFRHLSLLAGTLTSLNIVNIVTGENEEGNAVLECLQDMHRLQTLEMQFRRSLTSEGIQHICNCPLKGLDLSNHTLIDDDALRHISQMRRLQHLNLNNTRITDASLPSLAPLFPTLLEMQLQHTSITSAGLVELFKACSDVALEMTLLNLAFTGVGNKALSDGSLCRFCPSLIELNLSNTNVSDTGLKHLTLAHVLRLLLDGCKVRRLTDPGFFPNCPSLVLVRALGCQSRQVGEVSDPES